MPAQIELHAALAQLAFYRCDWEQVARSNESSAELAEREGLVGKLCLSYSLRGLLRWRDGDWEASAELFSQARDLAEQIGWSEVAFNALLGLAVTAARPWRPGRRGGHHLPGARRVRAGGPGRAVDPGDLDARPDAGAGGRGGRALEVAEQASELAQRVHYPLGEAAVLEARRHDRRAA